MDTPQPNGSVLSTEWIGHPDRTDRSTLPYVLVGPAAEKITLGRTLSRNCLGRGLGGTRSGSLLGRSRAFRRQLTGLRGGDALVLQVLEQYGFPLVSMDREIRKKAPERISALEPREFLSSLG